MKLLQRISTIALVVISIMSCKAQQETYQIKGDVAESMEIDSVSIRDSRGAVIAKAAVKDHSFNIEGSMAEPTKVSINYSGSFYNFILENDTYTVAITKDFATIKGGETNNIVYGFKQTKAYQKAKRHANKVESVAYRNLSRTDRAAIELAMKKVGEASKEYTYMTWEHYGNLIKGDYSVLIKAFALRENYDNTNYNLDKKIELSAQYQKELPNNAFIKNLAEGYQNAKKNEVIRNKYSAGKPFYDFTSTALNGEKIKLSDVVAKNKYTLIEFWASWCGPCRGSFPHLKKLYKKYHGKGFEVFGLSLDTKEKAYLKASKEEELPWIDTVDYKAFQSDAAVTYAVQGIPFTVLIGQDGIIIAGGTRLRGFALDDKLKELLGE